MTLNGGPAGRAGWRAVFPIEKHEFSAGCIKGRAKTDGPASCTLGRPAQESEPTGCTKGRAAQQSATEGCTKRRTAQQSAPEGCIKKRAAQDEPAGCTTGRAGGLQKNGGLHINTCRRAAEKGGPFDTRRTALKIITLASFRRSSRCAKWRTVRCKAVCVKYY